MVNATSTTTNNMFVCKCGNNQFKQPVSIYTHEIVEITKTPDGEAVPISVGLVEITEEKIEHQNEFECNSCGEIYRLSLENGKYIIV